MRRFVQAIPAVLMIAGMMVPLPSTAAVPGGPIILMGIDAEDGGPGGHGPIATYVGVVNSLLSNATAGSGILVLGGGKSAGDNVTAFWNAIAAGTGQSVTYANGASLGTVSFASFEIIAVVSDVGNTGSGGLTQAENDLLSPRDQDFADHVNNGGGLLGFSQTGLSTPWYPYLDAIGSFLMTAGGGSDITATPEGTTVGIGDSLDVCCWHDNYVAFPDFLVPLAHYAGTTNVGAIGGAKVIILRDCTVAEMTTTVTRPVDGRLYEDDLNIGPASGADAEARGANFTYEATTTGGPASSVNFYLDGVLLGSDSTAPYTVTAPLPPVLGLHQVKAIAFHATLPCRATGTKPLRIVCFDAVPSITRPVAGRLYRNDLDIGASGTPEAAAIEGALTLAASSTKPSRTASVAFDVDGVPSGVDVSSPYSGVVDTSLLSAGLHTVTATLQEYVPGCSQTISTLLRKPDPAILSTALGVSVTNAVPTQPVVTAGGVTLDGKGGPAHEVRVLDRNAAPYLDYVRTIVDRSEGGVGTSMEAKASSIVSQVSLMGGLITADVLESHAAATFDIAAQSGGTSSAGSRIAGLRINGNPIDVDQPNTTVAVPGVGTLVLQETVETLDGKRLELTVNALHLFLDPGYPADEIVLGSAHAGVNFVADVFTGPATRKILAPDDLHTGTDAGGTAATAMPITEGVHSAAFSAGDGQDVFRFDAAQGQRIIATVKPAERTKLHINPPPAPPALVQEKPNARLTLRDPNGAVAAQSSILLAGSDPQKVEINAYLPYDGTTAPWTLHVERPGGSPDGFYTIELSILPVHLLDQDDAGQPGDASDACAGARSVALAPAAGEAEGAVFAGVIRDADPADFYAVDATAGRVLSVTLKPDELIDGAAFSLHLYRPGSPGGTANCTVQEPLSLSTALSQAKAGPSVAVALPVLVSGTYVIEVRRVIGVANYTVSVAHTNPQPTAPGADAGSGLDAPDSCSPLSTPLASGLYQGTMIDLPSQDVEDWYSITISPGQDFTVVMKPSDPSDFDLALFDNACNPVPPDSLTLNGLPLSAPETAHVTNGGGTYRLRVTRDPSGGAGNYLLAVAVTP